VFIEEVIDEVRMIMACFLSEEALPFLSEEALPPARRNAGADWRSGR